MSKNSDVYTKNGIKIIENLMGRVTHQINLGIQNIIKIPSLSKNSKKHKYRAIATDGHNYHKITIDDTECNQNFINYKSISQ